MSLKEKDSDQEDTKGKIFTSDTLKLMLGGIILYISFIGTILATIHIPPEAILDSGLQEIILVFEG